jgi:hypothetical protein
MDSLGWLQLVVVIAAEALSAAGLRAKMLSHDYDCVARRFTLDRQYEASTTCV